MTLIVSHRLNQTSSIFLNDLRISPKLGEDIHGPRTDDVVKQLHVTDGGNHIGFFATGPRAYWQNAEKEVRNVLADLNPDDLLKDDTLQRALTYAAGNVEDWSLDDEKKVDVARASAFFLDLETQETVLFNTTVHLGRGCLQPKESPIGKPIVLGSGSSVEGLEDAISDATQRLRNMRQQYEPYFQYKGLNPEDFEDFFTSSYEFAKVLRQVILDYIQAKDPSLFEKKGISPFMMISILEDGGFRVVGEQSEGMQVKNGVWTQAGYHLGGDLDESVQITFPDSSTQKLTDLRQKDRPGSGRVDPEYREPPPLSIKELKNEERVFQLRQSVRHANWINEQSEASLSDSTPLGDLAGNAEEISGDEVEGLMTVIQDSIFAQRGYVTRKLVELQINTDLKRVVGQETHAQETRTFVLDDADKELLNATRTLTCVIDDPQPLLNMIQNCPDRIFDAEWLSDNLPDYTEEDAFVQVDTVDLE